MGDREQVLKTIEDALGGGNHLGDFIWFGARGVESTTRAEVARALTAAGLDPYDLEPDKPTPWEALGKAKQAWRRERRPIQLDKERKDQRHSPWLVVHKEGRTYDPLACVAVDPKNGDFIVETIEAQAGVTRSPHMEAVAAEVVEEIRAAYEAHFRCVSTAEVRGMITGAILGCWGGTRLKEDGHLYWLPSDAGFQSEVRVLKEKVIEHIGSSYLRVIAVSDTEGNRADVAASAREAFEAEIAKALAEVRGDKFTAEKSRESTFETRLSAYDDLRDRIELYSDLLGRRRKEMLADLDEATVLVKDMLSGTTKRRAARAAKRAAERRANQPIDTGDASEAGADEGTGPANDRTAKRKARRAKRKAAATDPATAPTT